MKNSRGFAVIPVIVILVIAGAAGFGLTRKACYEISPLKPGQNDPHAVTKNNRLYWCESYYEKLVKPIFSLRSPVSPESNVAWPEAIKILKNGQVSGVFQAHSRVVTLVLKSGQRINTVSPVIDLIWDEIKKCGEPCRDIIQAVE